MSDRTMPPIRTVRAPNPSPLTGSGTNTYLLGQGEVAVIDPGPAIDRHLDAILAALDAGERITHILVTHPHLDHSALAPRLSRATGAPVLGFGTATSGRSPRMTALASAGMTSGGEGLDLDFCPDLVLTDGDIVASGGWSLRALHTPGHLGAHLCFDAGEVLFSGDHVMGWSTSVVSPPDGDMTDYMASLRRLQTGNWNRFLPGHGDEVSAPAARLGELLDHRMDREAQILAALAEGAADSAALAARIYKDIPPRLLPAARRNVLAHLIDLQAKGCISTPEIPGPDAIFHPI